MDAAFFSYEETQNEFHKELVEKIGKEHSVIIYFNYGIEDDEPFYNLSDTLRHVIEENNLGLYDGHEIAMDNSDGSFYIYGPSAEEIFKAIKPVLEAANFMRGATAVLTFGPTGSDAPQLELEI
jgi:hypothetical protein